MRIDIFSLFPGMFENYLQESILKRAQGAGLIEVRVHNIRDWAPGRHHTTDEPPYGGGGGMVMKPEPIFAAVEAVLSDAVPLDAVPSGAATDPSVPIILLSPTGRQFTQAVAAELAAYPRLMLICGRYEGVDERVREHLSTDEISIGDFVVTGGELPAMLIVDAVARHIPGVLGADNAVQDDSHASGLLEYPHYTRPAEFRGWTVPEVLQSGDHARIARWRRERSLERTRADRPDLLERADLSEADRKFLRALDRENGGETQAGG